MSGAEVIRVGLLVEGQDMFGAVAGEEAQEPFLAASFQSVQESVQHVRPTDPLALQGLD
jgi:hypothetical protein